MNTLFSHQLASDTIIKRPANIPAKADWYRAQTNGVNGTGGGSI